MFIQRLRYAVTAIRGTSKSPRLETSLEDSILISVKKMLGIAEDYTAFDMDIIFHINSVFVTLYELGFGDTVVSIDDDISTWSDVLDNANELSLIKSLVYLKVRLIFDPPTSSAALQAMQELVREFEFRINILVDNDETE